MYFCGRSISTVIAFVRAEWWKFSFFTLSFAPSVPSLSRLFYLTERILFRVYRQIHNNYYWFWYIYKYKQTSSKNTQIHKPPIQYLNNWLFAKIRETVNFSATFAHRVYIQHANCKYLIPMLSRFKFQPHTQLFD